MADRDSTDPLRTEPHEMPRRRPWGPASYWRSGLVLLALVIAVILAMQM